MPPENPQNSPEAPGMNLWASPCLQEGPPDGPRNRRQPALKITSAPAYSVPSDVLALHTTHFSPAFQRCAWHKVSLRGFASSPKQHVFTCARHVRLPAPLSPWPQLRCPYHLQNSKELFKSFPTVCDLLSESRNSELAHLMPCHLNRSPKLQRPVASPIPNASRRQSHRWEALEKLRLVDAMARQVAEVGLVDSQAWVRPGQTCCVPRNFSPKGQSPPGVGPSRRLFLAIVWIYACATVRRGNRAEGCRLSRHWDSAQGPKSPGSNSSTQEPGPRRSV